jgi:hypothetical protein
VKRSKPAESGYAEPAPEVALDAGAAASNYAEPDAEVAVDDGPAEAEGLYSAPQK